jgi:peroxiredoxin
MSLIDLRKRRETWPYPSLAWPAKLVAFDRPNSSLMDGESRRLSMTKLVSICFGAILLFLPASLRAGDGPGANSQPRIGMRAPDFSVQKLDGGNASLAQYRGKVVLVNFWATWCGACKLEMPWLAQLREQYAKQGFEVLGIVTDGASSDKVKQIAEKYGVKYPILRCNHKTAQAYGGLAYLPSSFYISRSGKVILEASDASSKADIEADIRKVLASK